MHELVSFLLEQRTNQYCCSVNTYVVCFLFFSQYLYNAGADKKSQDKMPQYKMSQTKYPQDKICHIDKMSLDKTQFTQNAAGQNAMQTKCHKTSAAEENIYCCRMYSL